MSQLLKDLYEALYGPLDGPGKMKNLADMADSLSRIVNRERPWTNRYLNSLIKGNEGFTITEELERAIHILSAREDGQPEVQARSRAITVFTVNGIEPESIVFGHTTRCYCQLRVVFNHPNRKYCFEECRQRAKQERKRAAL